MKTYYRASSCHTCLIQMCLKETGGFTPFSSLPPPSPPPHPAPLSRHQVWSEKGLRSYLSKVVVKCTIGKLIRCFNLRAKSTWWVHELRDMIQNSNLMNLNCFLPIHFLNEGAECLHLNIERGVFPLPVHTFIHITNQHL